MRLARSAVPANEPLVARSSALSVLARSRTGASEPFFSRTCCTAGGAAGMDGVCEEEPLWVFGYGSLVWKPGVEHTASRVVCLHDWRRVFHQGSTDHRGTPGSPGRVVTLVRETGAVTWGRALRLPPPGESRQAALDYLEEREKQYDVRLRAPLHDGAQTGSLIGGSLLTERALLYVASSDRTQNANYLGPAPLAVIARTVAGAVGPSGANSAYVFRLASAMREMSKCDEELFQLEALVLQIQAQALTPAET